MGAIFFKDGRFIPETSFTYKDVKRELERYTDDDFNDYDYCKRSLVSDLFLTCHMNDCGNFVRIEELKCCHCIFSVTNPVKLKKIFRYLFEASKEVRKKHIKKHE